MTAPIDHPGIQECFEELRESITRVFPAEAMPSADELIEHECEECWGLRDDFVGRQWPDVPPEVIDSHCENLSLFAPFAHRYYLPAYLLRSFTKESDPWGGSAVVDFIIYDLCWRDDDDWWDSRFGIFTTQQLQVVARWFQCVLGHVEAFDPDLTEGQPGFEKRWKRYLA